VWAIKRGVSTTEDYLDGLYLQKDLTGPRRFADNVHKTSDGRAFLRKLGAFIQDILSATMQSRSSKHYDAIGCQGWQHAIDFCERTSKGPSLIPTSDVGFINDILVEIIEPVGIQVDISEDLRQEFFSTKGIGWIRSPARPA